MDIGDHLTLAIISSNVQIFLLVSKAQNRTIQEFVAKDTMEFFVVVAFLTTSKIKTLNAKNVLIL